MSNETKEFSFLAELDTFSPKKNYKLSFSSIEKVANRDDLGRDLNDSFGYEAKPSVYLCINTFEDRSLKLYFQYDGAKGYIVHVRSPVYTDDPSVTHNKTVYLGVNKATFLTKQNYVWWTVDSTRSVHFKLVNADKKFVRVDQLEDTADIYLWQAHSQLLLRAGEKGEVGQHWWRYLGDTGPEIPFKLRILERYNSDGSVQS